MHSAALGRILSPRRISLNCGGSYYITRNGGDKTSFFSQMVATPLWKWGVGGWIAPEIQDSLQKNASWLVRAVWCWAVLPKNRTRIVGREWLSLRYYHSPLRNLPPVDYYWAIMDREAFEIARRPTGAEQSLWAFWMILLHCIFWFIFYKKRR